MQIKIEHNEDNKRFETQIEGVTAYISYQLKDHVINFDHTIVPAELGGRGIASSLVKHALAFARQNNLKVIASCSFVDSYINKHPEYQDLLA